MAGPAKQGAGFRLESYIGLACGPDHPVISGDIRVIISAYRTENISDDHLYIGDCACRYHELFASLVAWLTATAGRAKPP